MQKLRKKLVRHCEGDRKNPGIPQGKAEVFAVGSGSSLLFVSLDFENLLALIKAAYFANATVLYELVTSRVGAFHHAGQRELAVVRASFVSACFRYFFLRYCHIYTSSCAHARKGRRA